MTAITIQSLSKRFGNTVAVDSINLTIDSGELFFLLGPSGCGKTTLLRMIAGFIEPDAGKIFFGDREITAVPPNRRNVGMVFQSYALWPHMTVGDNVAFGLNVRKIPAEEKSQRVLRALSLVQMQDYAQRRPNQLSGGQQQRVALARALVIEPTVLLLDEPLSNLDAKLRLEMRSEIRRLCKQVRITAVYVTHDQKEALSMADRMAVLRQGKLVQVGSPREMYDRPHSRFVADFLGETNFIEGVVEGAADGFAMVRTPAGSLRSQSAPPPQSGSKITCSIRPEALRLLRDGDPAEANVLTGRRIQTIYLGEMAQHLVEIPPATTVKVFEINPERTGSADEKVRLAVHPRDVILVSE